MISLFTNIPNPYNDRLLATLRASGTRVRAVYRSLPEAEGRPWPATIGPDDVVTGSLVAEAREWRAAADTDVILSGSYATTFDARRRLALSRRARTLHVWGERLRDNHRLVHLLRRGYFSSRGLDGILAIGSRAGATYETVTSSSTPIHVFPYTTDRGLDADPRPTARPTIGYAGRLLTYKGVDIVIRALAELAPPQRPRLAIAGSGPQASSWRGLAASAGVDADIDWLGELTPDALDDVRSQWWAQVVPSRRSEGWGVVVHEAMNAAVPVIASDHVNAAADLIHSGANGTILEPSATTDPRAWATAITDALDAGVRDRRGAQARLIGEQLAPVHAGPWLLDVLAAAAAHRDGTAPAPTAHSFVDDAWANVTQARRG